MLSDRNDAINKVVEKLKYVSADDEIRFKYEQREKARLDYFSDMSYSKEEGRQEGRQEGALAKALSIATSLLDILDVETIAKKTQLSIETVKELKRPTMSIKYYNEHANQFIQDTINADMSSAYGLFTKYLKPEATILDIGCGSGRDCKYFLSQGYNVYAHDGSEAMVEHTRQFLGDKVARAMFSDFSPLKAFGKELLFDGLWACASLIHVMEDDIVNVVNKYASYLVEKGVFFLSFKLRAENYEKDGRSFTNFTREKLLSFIAQCNNLIVIELQETVDVRPGRENEGWISVVVQKTSFYPDSDYQR